MRNFEKVQKILKLMFSSHAFYKKLKYFYKKQRKLIEKSDNLVLFETKLLLILNVRSFSIEVGLIVTVINNFLS